MDLFGTPQSQAWLQIVLGAGLVIAGLGTLLDSSANRIYVGAIVVGPILVIRGLRGLSRLADLEATIPPPAAAPLAAEDSTPPQPDDVKTAALQPDCAHVTTPCEACHRPYVYFPDMTITSQIQHKYLKHAAAPCPNCGWLQSYMIDLNGEFATPHWSEKCLLAGIALGIASAGLLAFNVNKFYGAGAQPDSYEPVYWFADLAVFLSALGCGVAHLCFINRRPDPNRAPLETRLKKGKFMGMPLDEYETLINAEGSAPARPGISSTGIQAPRTSAEAPTGSQEMP